MIKSALALAVVATCASACSGAVESPNRAHDSDGGEGGGGSNVVGGSGPQGAAGAGGMVNNLPPAATKDQVALPIEVFGADGTMKEVSFPLSDEAVANANQLVLRMHNVRYATKASVQLNGGSWIKISNETVELDGPAKAFGGIGGGYAVLDMKLDVPANVLTKGRNTLRFRFDKTDGLSMGFRVIGVDLRDSGGVALVPSNLFVHEDPSNWVAPAGADAKAGETVWATAELRAGPHDTAKLRARCSDCHAEDGRDLKYFNYSNLSIIERAKFHGLSEQQGKDIAAYVRELDAPAPGRPWNPPFQPGPGNTDRPVEMFSAGSGIDAVVDEDTTIAAIFKTGFDRSALADGNALRRISVNDIPVGLQLPDWNHWLPEVHAKDIVGDAFDTSMANVRFKALRDRIVEKQGEGMQEYLSTLHDAPFLKAGARIDFIGWHEGLWELRQAIPGVPKEGDPENSWTDETAKRTYAVAVWGQVRTWELMNRFGLESYAPVAYPLGEKRAWFSERHLFDVSPFLQGIRGGPNCSNGACEGRAWTGSSIGNTEVNYDYLSNSWYHLQLALNAGQRACAGHRCADYGYAFGFLNHLKRLGLYEGGRRLLWGIKAMEEHDNGKGPTLEHGFSLAVSNPLRPLALDDALAQDWWKDPAHPDRAKALAITAQVFAEKLGTWTVDSWRKENYGKSEDGANFMDASRVVGQGGDETIARSIGDGLWYTLPTLFQSGVHPALVNALARFGLALWPRNDWMSQGKRPMGSAPAAPTLSARDGAVKIQWSAGAASYNVYRATSSEGPWLAVALMRSGTSTTDVPLQKGVKYYYAVSANAAGSESPLSKPASVTP